MKRKAHNCVDINDAFDEEATLQYGGGFLNEPLFNFNFAPLGPHRSWRNVLERGEYCADLQQLR